MTELCNLSIVACIQAEPLKIFDLIMGGVILFLLAIALPLILWRSN